MKDSWFVIWADEVPSKAKALKQMQREDESLIESAENVNLHIKWLILEIFLLYE